jgi:hypothetical protein
MLELALVLAFASSGQFDASEIGAGGRAGWLLSGIATLEAEVVHYPGDFGEPRPFSRARTEGLFGATIGPRLGAVRPFARLRPGFLRFEESPEPFPCIRIFPPPLICELASGGTLAALDAGGGVEVLLGARTFARIDAGARFVRYPAPVFDADRRVREDPFIGRDVRLGASGGIRF